MRPSNKGQPPLTVSVRQLVEFVLRTGDLGSDRDFVGAARAWQGLRGHQLVQRSRPPGYETEVRLSHRIETPDLVLVIRGRIDGVLRTGDSVRIEEIKTILGPGKVEADPLHWGQAKVYAAIYAQQHGLDSILVQLTYLELGSNRQTEFCQTFSRTELRQFFDEVTSAFLHWARAQQAWRRRRDRSILDLPFPHPVYRSGQRSLAVAVYRAISRRDRLFVEAPTGIGKTISALFPALKALAEGLVERVFYLTAKTVGRHAAEKALEDLRRAGLGLRSLSLTAKEKICRRDGQLCEVSNCPLALGYYDRIRGALEAALQRQVLTRPALEELALTHQVCPYELSLDASLWVDVIIGDYNYVFDPKVYLKRHFADEGGPFVFLIDEAHNLVDRSRDMFSADLDKAEMWEVKRAIQPQLPGCAKALNRLNRYWSVLARQAGQSPPPSEQNQREMGGDESLFDSEVNVETAGSRPNRPPNPMACPGFPNGGLAQLSFSYRGASGADDAPILAAHAGSRQEVVSGELPRDLLPLLAAFLREASDWLSLNQPSSFRETLLALYFRVTGFLRTAESYDERYCTILEGCQRQARLRLFCLDPSHLLRQALKRGQSAIFFSATLTPLDYFREVFGGELHDRVVQLPSPFPPENLCLLVHERIRTDFKARTSTYNEVTDAIGALIGGKPGNYLVYFPSYHYLNQVRERWQTRHPGLRTLSQVPGMDEEQRDAFLAEFRDGQTETLVGFAVMGGLFGEAIDLVGQRLVGAVIVGVGLPQICLERDLIRAYFDQRAHTGFDYAYRFPGLNRVLQALGRVIRSETDRGVGLLIDVRFGEPRYRRLLPPWWSPRFVRSVDAITAEVAHFWARP